MMRSVFVLIAIAVVSLAEKMPMAGAPVEQNANKPEHMDRAWRAVNQQVNHPASNAGPYHLMPIKILSATSQVVAGSMHKYEVLLGETNCKKGDVLNTELTQANCQLRDGANRSIYKVSVWEKPWENFEQFEAEKVRDVAHDEQI